MPIRCAKCQRELSDVAKFCKHCGATVVNAARMPPPVAPLPRYSPPPVASPQATVATLVIPAPAAAVPYCEQCQTQNVVGFRFCRQCGAAAGATPTPKPAPIAPTPWQGTPPSTFAPLNFPTIPAPVVAPVAAALVKGSGRIAGIGAALAFLGCILPMMNGIGEYSSIFSVVPQVLSKNAPEEVLIVLILPLTAIFLAVLAGFAEIDFIGKRVIFGGAVIALASPWVALSLLMLYAVMNTQSAFSYFSRGMGVGPGLFVLAAGFILALVGGFTILHSTSK